MAACLPEIRIPARPPTGHLEYQNVISPVSAFIGTLDCHVENTAYESSESFRVRCPGVLIQTNGFGRDLTCYPWLHLKHPRGSDEWLAQDFS
jgi:hypothetical protein